MMMIKTSRRPIVTLMKSVVWLLFFVATISHGFSPRCQWTRRVTFLQLSDQWDDENNNNENNDNNEPSITSFDDAKKGMIAEAEAKELEAMGGYDDIVPGVSIFVSLVNESMDRWMDLYSLLPFSMPLS